jgi:hypothetical protein
MGRLNQAMNHQSRNVIFNVYEEENDKKIQKGKKDGGINRDGQKYNCGNNCTTNEENTDAGDSSFLYSFLLTQTWCMYIHVIEILELLAKHGCKHGA